jgi:hypothetical protein
VNGMAVQPFTGTPPQTSPAPTHRQGTSPSGATVQPFTGTPPQSSPAATHRQTNLPAGATVQRFTGTPPGGPTTTGHTIARQGGAMTGMATRPAGTTASNNGPSSTRSGPAVQPAGQPMK